MTTQWFFEASALGGGEQPALRGVERSHPGWDARRVDANPRLTWPDKEPTTAVIVRTGWPSATWPAKPVRGSMLDSLQGTLDRVNLNRFPRLLFVARAMVYLALFIVVGAIMAATLPGLFGLHSVTILSGSMGDSIPTGSVVVLQTVEADDLEVGDVIAVDRGEGALPFIHRIVAIDEINGERVATTKGDANAAVDPEPLTLGGSGDRVLYHVPYVGYFFSFARSPLGLVILVGLPVAWLALVQPALKKRQGAVA